MSGSLDQLLEDGVIDEVLARLKSGKEADVWLVRHHADVLAAKLYKERSQRSFKNSSGYKEGRAVRNSRTQRAMDRGSRFGQAAAEEEWKSAEADALHKLHAAGVRVPTPVLFYEGVLLMELVVDEEGRPAPRLIDALVPAESAGELYADLRAQAVRMLCCDLIHGDLSPYNVLLGAAGPTIIDFPQVVSAAQNSRAQEFFVRDIENLREFFAAADPVIAARKSDAAEIWQAYVRRDLSPEYVPTGRWVAPQERQHSAPRVHGARPAQPHAPAPGKHGRGGQQQGPRASQQGGRQQPHGPRRENTPPPHASPAGQSRADAVAPAGQVRDGRPRHHERRTEQGGQQRPPQRGQPPASPRHEEHKPRHTPPRHDANAPPRHTPPRHDANAPPRHTPPRHDANAPPRHTPPRHDANAPPRHGEHAPQRHAAHGHDRQSPRRPDPGAPHAPQRHGAPHDPRSAPSRRPPPGRGPPRNPPPARATPVVERVVRPPATPKTSDRDDA